MVGRKVVSIALMIVAGAALDVSAMDNRRKGSQNLADGFLSSESNERSSQREDHKDEVGRDASYDQGLRAQAQDRLVHAVKLNKIDEVMVALRDGADINSVWGYGSSVLYFAATEGHIDLAKMALSACVDVSAVTKYKNKSLHGVVSQGYVEIAALLLDHGADANAINGDRDSLLHSASKRGDSIITRLLIKNKADVNRRDEDDETPLHKGVCGGHVKVVELLLEAKADINAINRYDKTPLHCAIKEGHVECAKTLIKSGASVSKADMYGNTPLHLAVYGGCDKIITELILAGGDVHAIDGDGQTVFYLAPSDMLQVMVDARAARAQKDKLEIAGGIQRTIVDLPVMVRLAVCSKERYMVPWLLHVDPDAAVSGGICSICTESFAKRVIDDGVELVCTSVVCPHLICDECDQSQCRAHEAVDTERDRGIYLGQDRQGNEQWAFPGDIDLRRCPECRAQSSEYVASSEIFLPYDYQLEHFNKLKEEFKETELLHSLSCLLKNTDVLKKFGIEEGIIALVDGYIIAYCV